MRTWWKSQEPRWTSPAPMTRLLWTGTMAQVSDNDDVERWQYKSCYFPSVAAAQFYPYSSVFFSSFVIVVHKIPIYFFLFLIIRYRFGGKCVMYRSLLFMCPWENSGENSLRSQLWYLSPPNRNPFITEIKVSPLVISIVASFIFCAVSGFHIHLFPLNFLSVWYQLLCIAFAVWFGSSTQYMGYFSLKWEHFVIFFS